MLSQEWEDVVYEAGYTSVKCLGIDSKFICLNCIQNTEYILVIFV